METPKCGLKKDKISKSKNKKKKQKKDGYLSPGENQDGKNKYFISVETQDRDNKENKNNFQRDNLKKSR